MTTSSPRTTSARDGLVEELAAFLCSEFDYDLNPVVGAQWPEHPNDDGYRGDHAYARLQPSDVQARARENANRILVFLRQQSKSADRLSSLREEPRVKELTWAEEFRERDFVRYQADTELGLYTVATEFQVFTHSGPKTMLPSWRGPFSTMAEDAVSLDAAKACAQSDFEKRIRSSLEATPETPFEDAVKAKISEYLAAPLSAKEDALAGRIAYALTKRLVIDMPTARAAVDEAICNVKADETSTPETAEVGEAKPVAWATDDILEHLRSGHTATVAPKRVGAFTNPLYATPVPTFSITDEAVERAYTAFIKARDEYIEANKWGISADKGFKIALRAALSAASSISNTGGEKDGWRDISTYPLCESCDDPGCDWGPDVLLRIDSPHGHAVYVGHKEAGEWLTQSGELGTWDGFDSMPSAWSPIPSNLK